MTDDPEAYRGAVRRAVIRALASHGGDAAADVGEDLNPAQGVWGIDVTPEKEGAASVYLVHSGGDEMTLGFGETHTYLWDKDPLALADEVERILSAVFAGRIVEADEEGACNGDDLDSSAANSYLSRRSRPPVQDRPSNRRPGDLSVSTTGREGYSRSTENLVQAAASWSATRGTRTSVTLQAGPSGCQPKAGCQSGW